MIAGLMGCGGGSTAPPQASDPPPTEAPATADATVRFPDLSTTTSATSASTLVPPATVAADDLAASTAITPLDGFSEVAAAPGIGPLDLTGAAHGEPRERDALLRFGFRDGHARGFTKDGEEIVVTVLRFGSAAQAGAYLQDTLDSSLSGNGSFLFAVPVPGATGYREQGAGDDGEPFVTYGALFARGDRCYEQLIRSPASGRERSEADAQALARRQAERVGG